MKVFGMGLPELIIILLVVLLFWGPKNLPKLGAMMGRTIKKFRNREDKEFEGIDDEGNQIQGGVEESDSDEEEPDADDEAEEADENESPDEDEEENGGRKSKRRSKKHAHGFGTRRKKASRQVSETDDGQDSPHGEGEEEKVA
jgi:sec-independent protein translocase protein TatA